MSEDDASKRKYYDERNTKMNMQCSVVTLAKLE